MKYIGEPDLTGKSREEVAAYARWRFFSDGESKRGLTFYDRITDNINLEARQVKAVLRAMGAHSWFVAQALKARDLWRPIHTQPLWVKDAPHIFVEVDSGQIFRNLWRAELGVDAEPPEGILDISPGEGWTIEELVRDVDLWDEQQKAMRAHWGIRAGAKRRQLQPPAGGTEEMR